MANKITERIGFMSVSAFYVDDDDLREWSALPPFDADTKIAKLKTTVAQREFEIQELQREIQELQIELINTHGQSQTHLESLSKAQPAMEKLLIAFHDAINRPKGTVPTSGDEFYCAAQATKQAT